MKSCTRRIAFDSPKKSHVVDRFKPTRLSKQSFEKVSLAKKKVKKLTENGSLRSVDSSAAREEKGRGDKIGVPTLQGEKELSSTPHLMTTSNPDVSCPSMVPESSESQRTLAAVSRLKLASGSTVDDLMKLLKDKVETEMGEWIATEGA